MTDDNLVLPVNSFIVFIDETGVEDLSDPGNPTFGRAGCGCRYSEYDEIIRRPWRRLKRERLGGSQKPFHAVEFERSKPTRRQIGGINEFMRRPFWRFGVMLDKTTTLPNGMDAHKAISLVTHTYFARFVEKLDVETVALIFEGSQRGDGLVRRDYEKSAPSLRNIHGRTVNFEGYFMNKNSAEPGLEVADLIAHTTSRQRRFELKGGAGHLKDFQMTYWDNPIPPEFMAISSISISEAIDAG